MIFLQLLHKLKIMTKKLFVLFLNRAPNNDYSPSNLQGVKDVIYFNLFDEVVIDMLQDERDRATNVHQRMERRWLGSISMPFSTVYFQSRVS